MSIIADRMAPAMSPKVSTIFRMADSQGLRTADSTRRPLLQHVTQMDDFGRILREIIRKLGSCGALHLTG